jgi:exosortase/archaeosortase family protein
MDGDIMYVFGKDLTPAWFHTACVWLTKATAWFVYLFPGSDTIVTGNVYFIGEGTRISIIWGCTGIKQLFIFSGIMICYFGPWKKKLWYIPTGCVILTVYNIIRIGSIVLLTKGHGERFDSLHNGIFRYIYYGIIFLIWLYWEEVIVKKHKLKTHDDQSKATVSS